MRAYITVWGKKYPVDTVWWTSKGKFLYVVFTHESGTETVFHQEKLDDLEKEDGILIANLNELITWEES